MKAPKCHQTPVNAGSVQAKDKADMTGWWGHSLKSALPQPKQLKSVLTQVTQDEAGTEETAQVSGAVCGSGFVECTLLHPC